MRPRRDIDDEFQERVAIKIYDANMTEDEAIKQARVELCIPAASQPSQPDLVENTQQRR